ncbi:hypothetical protein WDW89_04635 [Deltaproteobacteria bacterium TL4]
MLYFLSLGFFCVLWADQTFDFHGEASTWLDLERGNWDTDEGGVRYLPTLTPQWTRKFQSGWNADAEIAVNFYVDVIQNSDEGIESSGDSKAHRLWGRIYTDDLEIRIGLQKINFGPGKILRPLQWFDRIDPLDPTKFTEGVRALLLRNYSANDSNYWIWILYGNRDGMGISPFSTWQDQPEFGGRFQLPVSNGEIAFSLHQRDINVGRYYGILMSEALDVKASEDRIGLDGQWDVGVGIWMESVLLQIDSGVIHQQFIGMLGTDYTFDFGRGLYCSLEIMEVQVSNESKQEVQTSWTVAYNQSYSLSLLDQVLLIGLLNHSQNENITTLNIAWQRTYDDFLVNTGLQLKQNGSNRSGDVVEGFSDNSQQNTIRLLLQYNH